MPRCQVVNRLTGGRPEPSRSFLRMEIRPSRSLLHNEIPPIAQSVASLPALVELVDSAPLVLLVDAAFRSTHEKHRSQWICDQIYSFCYLMGVIPAP